MWNIFIEKTKWYKVLKQYKRIVIFGAKEDALYAYQLIGECMGTGEMIECFIVSGRDDDNPICLAGKSVKNFNEIDDDIKNKGLVIISQAYNDDCKMRKILSAAGFKNIVSSTIQIADNVTKELRDYCSDIFLGEGGIKMVDEFVDNNENFCIDNKFNICIYSVTSCNDLHVQKEVFESKYITYIQAGSVLTNYKICDVGDDSGDNISNLNKYFCELTAGYWIYRNDTINDYVGLYHYSRGLDMTDNQIDNIVSASIDVVLPFPYIFRHEVITRMNKFITNTIYEAVKKVSPNYVKTVEAFYLNKIFFPGNIVFCKKTIFCEYYEWMFRVLDECRRILKDKNIEVYSRQYGYFGEHLTNIYFLQNINKYSILYSKIKRMF